VQIFEGAYEVVVDGEEAVREANAVRADLILMDIALPELNGLEAVPAIRQDRDLAETPIVAVSSRVMPGREEALSAGCDAFVAKPMDDSELLGLVDGFLRR
jgi:CheY-like chemotaxis protein